MSKSTQIGIYVALGLVILALLGISAWAIDRANTAGANVQALQDTLHTVELQNGDLVTYTQALVTDKNKLSKAIEDKDGHIAELEKKVGKLQSYTRVETVYEVNNIITHDTVVMVDGRPCVGFGYQDEWLVFEGTNCDSTITMDKLRLTAPIEVGITEDNKVTATSPCKYLKISDVSATVKQQRKKRWNVGVQGGFGVGYDILSRGLFVGPYLGVGISYGFDF